MAEKRYSLGLFGDSDKPDVLTAYQAYQKALDFNTQINLEDTVKCNENFYIGKQWEGVQANGLPTPQFNILKRVTGFIVATITTDNIKLNASALANTPNTEGFTNPINVLNDEFEALNEQNDLPALIRDFARNAAVDGDGCIYTYWDADADCGNGVKGAIKDEIIDNTRVFFGNPSVSDVQRQPFIQITRRDSIRDARIAAKENGVKNWEDIVPDTDESNAIDGAKYTDDKVTVILTLWRNSEDGEIWAYESTKTAAIREPWSLGIRLYPVVWLCWDKIKDCYHGQAMITGLIPNQIFINKAWAMTMLSIMRSAFPKTIFDKTRIKQWDNRVGGAIGINGGDVNNVARILEPAQVSPQISQYIQLAVEQTEQSLGATSVALGDTRPDNTSAIIALQRAAATPSETTKQNLYKAIEQHARIQLEFMAEYYGTREVDIETPPEVAEALQFAGEAVPATVPQKFDYATYKDYPMLLKLDVGASSYYSEIAAMQTLDNLLMNQRISTTDYLERIPDGYVPKRRALIAKLKAEEQAQMQAQAAAASGAGAETAPADMEIQTGSGNGSMQRAIAGGQDPAEFVG